MKDIGFWRYGRYFFRSEIDRRAQLPGETAEDLVALMLSGRCSQEPTHGTH